MNKKLRAYFPLVSFLGETLGPQYEIVLHDLEDLDQSVVAIENNHISERTIGSPATDLLLNIIKSSQEDDSRSHATNYLSYSKTGKKVKGSTFLIRDEDDAVIGALCINFDISIYYQAYETLKKIVEPEITGDGADSLPIYKENLNHSIEDITTNAVESVIHEMGVAPERMLIEEKMTVIEKLNKDGVFLLKGAVGNVAKCLKVSEATIYRYLNKIK